MADVALKMGHLAKDQADLLPSIAINDGQVIYHEKNGMQFADYDSKRHSYGSVISGVFNGSTYVDFSTSTFDTILEAIKTTEAVHHGQIINVNNSIFMYKKVNDNNFIVKINDTESSVTSNTAGYIIHLPEYQTADTVTIDAVISIADEAHGEKVFFVKIVNGVIDYSQCQDLHQDFIAGDLGISVVQNGGLIAIVSTMDSNLKVISYSVDSTGSAINNGFYIAASDIELVFTWTNKSALPYNFYSGTAVAYNGEIHIIGGSESPTSHYKWNGTSWVSVSTLPFALNSGAAAVYNNEIHVIGGSGSNQSDYMKHYKWNGTSWVSVSTLPVPYNRSGLVVYQNELHAVGGFVSGDSENYSRHYKWNGTRWISVSVIPYDALDVTAMVYNNEIHIMGTQIGAATGQPGGLKAHYKWDGRTWSSVSTLPIEFIAGYGVLVNGQMHIFGGLRSPLAHYTWNGTTWTKEDDLPYNFSSSNAVALNNEIHIMGSYYNSATTNSKNHYVLGITQ